MSAVLAQDVAIVAGQRRSISDKLTMVDAKALPLSSMIRKGKQDLVNPKHEWPMMKNIAPRRIAKVDGQPAGAAGNAFDGNYGVGSNHMQWFEEVAGVGKLAQIGTNMAGVPNKMAKAVAMYMVRLKRNWEVSIGSDDAAVVATGAVAGVSRGIGDMLLDSAQAVMEIPASFRPPAGSVISTASGSLTETIIQAWLQSSYGESGKKQTFSCVCGQAFKNAFRGFYNTATGSANVMSTIRMFSGGNTADKKIVNSVDVYEGDWGTLELIPSLWNAYYAAGDALQPLVTGARAYGLTLDSWEWVGQQGPERMELPKDGGGERAQLDMVGCLTCENTRDQLMSKATS